MRLLAIFTLVLSVACALPAKSQQNNNWYFGSFAGMNFSASGGQSTPTLLSNSAMVADEGSAAISDSNGNLLFYTNGVKVYNKQHQVMLNGDGLLGNISACQSSMIIPIPGDEKKFYLFTTDAVENNFEKGYRYSIVDMNGDNGNGEVTDKNTLLWASCSERMTAVRHANGIDVWLITNDYNSNIFRSWLISCNGLNPNPVTSTTGIVMDQHVVMNTGFMKVSPNGKLLCQTHFPLFDPDVVSNNFVQLFDFDNMTGLVSNPRSISRPGVLYTSCEFSPDSRLLYLTRPYQKSIDQLEATLATENEIVASVTTIPTVSSFAALQQGPDERIYCFKREQAIGVINFPNEKGTFCDLVENAYILSPRSSLLGAPAFINDAVINTNHGFNYSIVDSCTGSIQFNGFSNMSGSLSWHWDFGDGTTSSQQNPVHSFTPAHITYEVKLTITTSTGCGVIRKLRYVQPKKSTTSIDFDFVVRCDSGYIRFENKNLPAHANDQFTWDFGDGQQSNEVSPVHNYNPGRYTVTLRRTNSFGCRDATKSHPVSISSFNIATPPDQTIMVGQSVQLYANGNATSYQWSPPTSLSNTTIANPIANPLYDIVYKIVAVNADDCVIEDSIKITVIDMKDVFVPTGFTPNNDGRNDDIRPYFPLKIELKDFSIYSRWGQKVFSSSLRGKGWNGKIGGIDQGTGVYVWTLKLIDPDTGSIIERNGTFVLIR